MAIPTGGNTPLTDAHLAARREVKRPKESLILHQEEYRKLERERLGRFFRRLRSLLKRG